MPLNKVCECCGSAFSVPACRASARFCSMTCRNNMRSEKRCDVCGSAFTVRPCELSQRFCSHSCRSTALWDGIKTAMKEGRRRQDSERFAKGQIPCLQCGKQFYVPAHIRSHRQFCTKQCADLAKCRDNSSRYRNKKVSGKTLKFHRAIAEETIGRNLLASEIVHHIDGKIRNNGPTNLFVMKKGDHTRIHNRQRWHAGALPTAEELVRQFPDGVWLGKFAHVAAD